MEDFNLHLTGDTHAVSMAHNLLAAMIDNHLNHGNALEIDPFSISWPRVVDISDRALRNVIIGLGGKENGVPRETSFDIAVASEVMAVLGLATSVTDLRERLGRIIVAMDKKKQPITAEDLGAAGAMTVLLRDAIKPNLCRRWRAAPCSCTPGPSATSPTATRRCWRTRSASRCATTWSRRAASAATWASRRWST